MLLAGIPTKYQIPWANAAGGSYIRPIPTPSQQGVTPGAASLTDGFPPACFTPVAAGGIPPAGQDFNGALKQVTQWLQWFQAGGGAPYFDAAFSTAIGGYPQGAFLQAKSGPGAFWISNVDNNVNDPDVTGTNWTAFPGPTLVQPSRVVTTNATVNLSCSTDVSLGLNRSSPAPMTVNLAATGTLVNNQVFEIEDLSANLDLGSVTVVPPAGHTICGQPNFTMDIARQSSRFKFYGNGLWSVRA